MDSTEEVERRSGRRREDRDEWTEAELRQMMSVALAKARSMGLQIHDAEDVAQQVVMTMLGGSYGPSDVKYPLAFANTISHRRSVDLIRLAERRARPDHLVPRQMNHVEAVESVEDEVSTKMNLEVMMLLLSQPEFKVFYLREVVGLSYGEISEQLGIGGASVRSRMLRSRRKLASAVESHEGLASILATERGHETTTR